MSDEENLSSRALSARYLVREAVEDAGRKELFSSPRYPVPDLRVELAAGKALRELPVCIVGAGIAGLRIATFLEYLEVEYEIIEASDRHGGRARTHHFSTADNDYFDIGAMRFPRIRALKLTFSLFEELGLTSPTNNRIIDYVIGTDNNLRLFNNHKLTSAQASTKDDPYDDGYHIPQKYLKATFKKANGETVKGAAALLAEAMDPFKRALAVHGKFKEGFEKLMKVDHFSVRGYLSEKMKIPFMVIEWIERTQSSTGSYNLGFSEAVLESMQFDYPDGSGSPGEPKKQKWACVQGGTSVVTDLLCQSLSKKPLYNSRVTAIEIEKWHPPLPPNMSVTVPSHPELNGKIYSHVFATTTLSCLSLMDLNKAGLSYIQRQAIRSLAYGPAVKMGIKFKTRWWQDLKEFPQIGGSSYTDRPVRVVVYPSNGVPPVPAAPEIPAGPEVPAVLMASYSWTQDALRSGAFSAGHGSTAEQHLLDIFYKDLAALHGKTPEWYRSETVSYFFHDWYHDEFSVGAYAHFGPGQYRHYYPDMSRPAGLGSLHFAGEASSAQHAWIEGALASAWRCTYQFLSLKRLDLLQKFLDKWPTRPEEVDLKKLARPGDIQPILEGQEEVDYEMLHMACGIELSRLALLEELKS